ncbi:MAG: nucleotide sugar dehydrogenase [Legionellaceae bacterium]|nr:nucleotide sugar dehydrogenase [Legionellaceae bacterium]
MKIATVGLWHLGSVTAACLACSGFEVIAYDPDPQIIDDLKKGSPPIFEPGLEELVNKSLQLNSLIPTSTPEDISGAEVVWVTFDTPVDNQDNADVDMVFNQVAKLVTHMQPKATILISSQMPVGTTKKLQDYINTNYPGKEISCAYSPENLRLGKAINVFQEPDRVVIGISSNQDKLKLTEVFKPFSDNLIWMSVESAEMTKHAINAFFATSVVFINELASLCEKVGANAKEVEQGLKSEDRIGPKAYLRAGTAIAGGTLARDVNFLNNIGGQLELETPLLSSILTSNQHHKQWPARRVQDVLIDLADKKIAVLGLTYKPNTNTLRRSSAVETCIELRKQGCNVAAFDPAIKTIPNDLSPYIDLKTSLNDALDNADALIIATEWPEFLEISGDVLTNAMRRAFVFDAGGFLMHKLKDQQNICYYTVGSQNEINRT